MPARRPQHPKRSGAVGVVVEHGDEQAFTKLPADGEVRQIGDAQALLGHIDQRLKRACDRRFRQFNLDAGLLRRQGPLLEPSAGRKPVVQTGMSLEVIRGFGNTFGREISRGRHQAPAIGAQGPRHQARVAGVGEAHHGVKTLLDHIDDPIAEIEIQHDLGIGPHERRERRYHQHADQWQTDTQRAARGLVCLRQLKLGCFDFRKDAPAAIEEQGAFRGECDAARAAMEEAHAEPFLHPSH